MRYIPALLVFIAQEALALIVFPMLNHYLGPEGKAWDREAILKGVLERLVLYTALIHGYPHMLIAFSAMKLGTRLHTEQGTEISNTYFLVGNLLSLLLVIVSSVVTKEIWQE
jgi:hypothetical protein